MKPSDLPPSLNIPLGRDPIPLSGVIDKVRNSAISGAAVTVLIAAARQSGYKLDPELAAAIVLLTTSLVGYLTKLKWREVR